MIRPRKAVHCLLALFATFATIGAAGAQNLLTNGDFDSGAGLDGWTWGPGTLALGSDSGSCLLSQAAFATSAMAASDQYFAMYSTQCIPVDPLATPTLHLGALYQTSAPVYARLSLQSFTDAGCANFESFYDGPFGPTSVSWTALGGPVTLAPTTHGIQVTADFLVMASGTAQFTGSFDRFYLGVAPRIFVDDFETESGSACHWSAIVD